LARRKIYLTESIVRERILRNPQIVAKFNFLNGAKQKLDAFSGCAKCQRGAKGAALTEAIKEVQRQLAQMNKDDRKTLKDLLGVDELQVAVMKTLPDGSTAREIVSI
jgi:hypothetical protein